MGITITRLKRPAARALGGLQANLCSIDFDNSYDAGGETVASTLANIRAGDVVGVAEIGGDAEAVPYLYKYQTATNKLRVYSAAAGGIVPYAPGGGDFKGSANTNVGIAGGTLPTNGALWSTLAAANNTNAFTIAAQPDVPRNVCISFKNTNAGASTGNAVDVVVVGLRRGAVITETLSFTALELTSTAQNEVASKYGSKLYDTITSITPSAAQPANWQHAAGPGSKLGLPVDLWTPLEADVLKITKNASNLSPSGIVDITNMSVNFGTLADGDDVAIQFRAAAQEVPAGTDLSGVKLRAIIYTLPNGVS